MGWRKGEEGGMEKTYAEVQERIKCARNKMNKQQHLETDWKKAKLKVHLGRRKQDPDFHRSGKIRSLEKVLLKKKKKRPCGLVTCTRKQTNLGWFPSQEISICI